MQELGGRLAAATAAAVLTLTACSSASDTPINGTGSAPPLSSSPSTSTEASASSRQQVATFSRELQPLLRDYKTAAQDYKQDVIDKDLPSAVVDARRLKEVCTSAASLTPSGDEVIDTNWPLFTSECQTGWNLIIRAFETNDRELITQAHAHFDQDAKHMRVVTLRLIALDALPAP